MKIASIDIGTNTILLLLCKFIDGKLQIVEDYHKIARLGENLTNTGFISQLAINRATNILNFYKEKISYFSPDKILPIATSAMRDAKNGTNVKSKFEEILGTGIEIISGKREAELSFIGSAESEKSIVIDIGGGSTEIIKGKYGKLEESISLEIGAVRIAEMFDLVGNNTKSGKVVDAQHYIDSLMPTYNDGTYSAYAVAGTPNTIAMIFKKEKEFSRKKMHNFKFSYSNFAFTLDEIRESTSERLINNYNVHPNRADIIFSGALILDSFYKKNRFNDIFVSSNGLRFGVALDFFNKRN